MLTRKGYEESSQNISPAMFLATSYDKASEAWTRLSPNVLVSDVSNQTQAVKSFMRKSFIVCACKFSKCFLLILIVFPPLLS